MEVVTLSKAKDLDSSLPKKQGLKFSQGASRLRINLGKLAELVLTFNSHYAKLFNMWF